MDRMQFDKQTDELVDSLYTVSSFAIDLAKNPSVSAETETQIMIQKQLTFLKDGLSEAESLAMYSEYVTSIEKVHQKLLQENEMLRLSLTHIHELLKVDDQQDLEEQERQRRFDDEMRVLDEQLGQDIQFGSDVSFTSEFQLANDETESSLDNYPEQSSINLSFIDEWLNDNRKRVAEDTLQQQYPKKAHYHERQEAVETLECIGHWAMCICKSCERIEDEECPKVENTLVLVGLPEMHKDKDISLYNVVRKLGSYHNIQIEPEDLTSVHRDIEHENAVGHRNIIISFKEEYLCGGLYSAYLKKNSLWISDIIPDPVKDDRLCIRHYKPLVTGSTMCYAEET